MYPNGIRRSFFTTSLKQDRKSIIANGVLYDNAFSIPQNILTILRKLIILFHPIFVSEQIIIIYHIINM